MKAFVAGIVAVPAVVIAIAVTYQVGDYFDPEAPQLCRSTTLAEQLRCERQHPTHDASGAPPPIEQKIGRGLKQGAMGVGALVLIPVAVLVGLVLSIVLGDKRPPRSRIDDLY